jgi:hypothetical protein
MKKQSAFTLRSGNKPSIAKMAGVSPAKVDGTVPLSKEEEEQGTEITGGNKREVIIDLQDRIEFLESDIEKETKAMKKGKMISQVKKLKKRLKQLMQ